MQLLYTCLLYLIQPLVWLRLLWRSIKAPAYRSRVLERYGFCKGLVKPNGILVHSVSVGETIAAIPLIKALQQRYPNLPITVTTMTPTGSAQVIRSLGETVSHVYLPYDLPGSIKRFLKTAKPKMAIIMETELWPNMITQLDKQKIPLVIANARLSARSTKRYAKLGNAITTILNKIPHIAVQNQLDYDHFIQLGVKSDHLTVTGSIKFDIALSQEQQNKITALKSEWQLNRPVWIAASTHQGEDEIILQTHQQLLKQQPNLLLILVPRHPERFKSVEKLIIDQQLNYQLRSANQIPSTDTRVILGDTMGELMVLYALANVAFVGGSLIERGGHNPLEPILHDIPVVMGPHYFNFQAICDQLHQANGLIIADKTTLTDNIHQLLTDQQLNINTATNAETILKQNQGALDRLLCVIDKQLQKVI